MLHKLKQDPAIEVGALPGDIVDRDGFVFADIL
jgi:hypothetical protein